MRHIHRVPPAPHVMAMLYADYQREGRDAGLTFTQYLKMRGYSNPAERHHGMDDSARVVMRRGGPVLISIPEQRIQGPFRVKVLLIDFSDKVGTRPSSHYQELLFSKNTLPTGSMRDYYREVSLGKVDVTGTIHGWLRMPEPYSFYTNSESGGEGSSYPRNAQRMAEDAVRIALDNGIAFESELDVLGQGIVTALFIIHAGRGAEELAPGVREHEIWSHKWGMPNPVQVTNNMFASIYLTVPHDAKVGVCAHELGHLAFQWEDFYDPNYGDDGKAWDGSGDWDLMASGSHNAGGQRPAHPAALHKSQHDWIEVQEVRSSQSVTLDPYTPTTGKACKVISPNYLPGQYLILENRTRMGFDSSLPGEGLLVWRVDESKRMFAPDRPALQLIQADGQHNLERVEDWNAGDAGDPFPGNSGRDHVGDTGNISTSFPMGGNSSIFLKNIRRNPDNGHITLDVSFGEIVDPRPEEFRGEATPNMPIPDDDQTGVESEIPLSGTGVARAIAVAVDITHTFIGDLRMELIAPSGQRAVLHNKSGGGTANLFKTYRSASTPALQALLDTPVTGTWRLRVTDLAGQDTGTLKKWSIAIDSQKTSGSIHEERSPGIAVPDNDPVGISSSIAVSKAGVVRSMKVGVDISHTFLRDLRVELVGPDGSRAMLHNRAGGSNNDLKQTYMSTDTASLAAFISKPIRGDWTLRVADLEGQDKGTLNRWSLDIDLQGAVTSVKKEASPNLAIPDNTPGGVGSNVVVDRSGTVQTLKVKANITHTYIGDLTVELVAPSGERAMLHSRSGGRTQDLSIDEDSASTSVLTPLIGQPMMGNWILRVADHEDIDTGTLDSWSMEVGYVA